MFIVKHSTIQAHTHHDIHTYKRTNNIMTYRVKQIFYYYRVPADRVFDKKIENQNRLTRFGHNK